jgi:hypothetical protein
MPSGHTELATIVSMLLSHYDLLSLPMAILTIFVVGLQRIVTKKHNIEQVFVGLIFGLIYTKIYIETDVSEKSIMLISGVILIATLILMLYIDDIIQNDKIPDWVDQKMYPTIEKKKNVPFYVKYSTVLATLYLEDMPLYIDYNTLEMYLNECINKINESNIKFEFVFENNKTKSEQFVLYMEDKRRFSKVGFYTEVQHNKIIDKLGIPYENILISTFDIDTKVFPHYFSNTAGGVQHRQ